MTVLQVWRGEERTLLQISGTHRTLEVIGFCRHRFWRGFGLRFQMTAVAEMHGGEN